jgi:hypothetical protein
LLFPADVKNTCRRAVYGISCSKHLDKNQDLMAVMIYRKARNKLGTRSRPQCTPSHPSRWLHPLQPIHGEPPTFPYPPIP